MKPYGYSVDPKMIDQHMHSYPGIQCCVTLPITTLSHTDLVSFITLSDSQIPHSTSEQNAKQIANWRNIYEELYAHSVRKHDYWFNTSGWNNSYTKKPFAPKVMHAWLNDTLDKIKLFHPKSVLEIGCGSGLILFGLLNTITSYCGIDMSESAVKQLQILFQNQQNDIVFFTADANNFDSIREIRDKKFDCVIINSVIQYFPSVEYLKVLLRKLSNFLTSDAHIFFGDIRNYDLLYEYHESMVEHRAKKKPYQSKNDREERTLRSILRERELLVSPDFFKYQVQLMHPEKNAKLFLFKKQYINDNELSLFRYDAVIQIQQHTNKTTKDVVYCNAYSLDEIIATAQATSFESKVLRVSCIDKTLSKLNKKIAKRPSKTPPSRKYFKIKIPALVKTATSLGLNVMCMLDAVEPSHFDAIFYKGEPELIACDINTFIKIQHANQLLDIEHDALAYLRTKLPGDAVPISIYTIHYFPRTNNNEIDTDTLIAEHLKRTS